MKRDSELRSEVELVLRRAMPDAAWDDVDQDWKDFAARGAPHAFGHLVKDCRRAIRLYEAGKADGGGTEPRRRKPTSPSTVLTRKGAARLTPLEMKRASLLQAELARSANEHPITTQVRSDLTEGKILTALDATRLLTSDAAAVLATWQFKEKGAPTVGHTALVGQRTATDAADLDREHFTIELHWGKERSAVFEVSLPVVVRTRVVEASAALQQFGILSDDRRDRMPLPKLAWSEPGGAGENSREVYHGSALDTLRISAEHLAWEYRWKEPEVVWFLLTGALPNSPAVRVDLTQRQSAAGRNVAITLTVEPWVSVDSIASIYQHAQEWILGKRNRSISAKRLKIYEFVRRRRAGKGRRRWSELWQAWIKTNPDEASGDWRNFRRDYFETFRDLEAPNYAMGRTPAEMAKRDRETRQTVRRMRLTGSVRERLLYGTSLNTEDEG